MPRNRSRSPINRNLDNEMAQPTALEVQLSKSMVPEFNGNSQDLPYFIKQSERFIQLLRQPDQNCLFNQLLLENVKSRVIGDAREVLIANNCNTWNVLKQALINKYGDPRSEELLINDLTTTFQKPNENYESYYQNIERKLRILLEHVTLRADNEDVLNHKKSMFEQQALATFKSGIIEPYCTHLLNSNCATLEASLFECRRLDNHKTQIAFMQFLRNKDKPQNIAKPGNSKPYQLHQQTNFNANNGMYRPRFNNTPQINYQNQVVPFPRGPVNIRPAINVQKYFPTNSQVFGRNNNQGRAQNLNTPTPMSGVSFQRTGTNQRHFANPRTSNFTFQELTNVETTNEDNTVTDLDYSNFANDEHHELEYDDADYDFENADNDAGNFPVLASNTHQLT
jgi:hypothetical protein